MTYTHTASPIEWVRDQIAAMVSRPRPASLHLQHLVFEKADLDARLEGLTHFIASPVFPAVHRAERDRLRRQAAALSALSRVVGERIQAWSQPE